MMKKIVVCGAGAFIRGHGNMVEDVTGFELGRSYNVKLSKGVNGRDTLIQKLVRGEANVRLRDGMEKTHAWIL